MVTLESHPGVGEGALMGRNVVLAALYVLLTLGGRVDFWNADRLTGGLGVYVDESDGWVW